jgi:D-ribulokinase
MSSPSAPYFLGIDVGTGSARAGIFDVAGRMLAQATHDIALHQSGAEIAEQSSEDIWSAVVAATRQAVAQSGVGPEAIAGIGFDATCSLVLVDGAGAPVSVSAAAEPNLNIIVWMDHRATEQAQRINRTKHAVLAYVGGAISPEMETPKLLWLAENMPDSFARARHFFDLTDYLTWRSTGSLARSSCTLTCKWTYLSHERRWDESYFRAAGLAALADEGFVRIGTEVVDPGAPVGNGLSAAAAAAFGLLAGTPVAAGLIDAHAGGIGTVAASHGGGTIERTMAYVMGTSACTMTSSGAPLFVPGVWGPYFSAMVPGLWLNEGGQSAAGAGIEQLVRRHPAYPKVEAAAAARGMSVVAMLAEQAADSGDFSRAVELANGLHVVPDFNGNRSPLADPEARAIISGLSLDSSVQSLVALYVAGICGLGYGLRQIIEAQAARGARTDRVVVSGGAARSPLVRQLLADATAMPIVTTVSPEPVLLGSAMLAASASGAYSDLPAAMRAMSHQDSAYLPSDSFKDVHERRYQAYGLLQAAERATRT